RVEALFNATRRAYFDVTRAYNPYYYEVGLYDKVNNSYTLNPLNEEDGTDYLDYNEGPKKVNALTYIQARLNYDKTFLDKHNVSGLLVFMLKNRITGNAGSVQTSLPHRNIGLSGRFTYSYSNRYFVEFDFGYNGSERFDIDHRFGFFPSAGVAWQVCSEPFWEDFSKAVTNLKLRATYGLIGNDAIGEPSERFFYLSDVDMDDGSKLARFGTLSAYSRNGVSVTRYSNPLITWERSYKTNIGMDLELFHHLNFTADLWKEHRTHILMTRSDIPTTMGLSSSAIPKANVGEAQGEGVDLALDYSKFFNNNFWIKLRANMTYAVSKFLVYEEPEYENAPWKSKV